MAFPGPQGFLELVGGRDEWERTEAAIEGEPVGAGELVPIGEGVAAGGGETGSRAAGLKEGSLRLWLVVCFCCLLVSPPHCAPESTALGPAGGQMGGWAGAGCSAPGSARGPAPASPGPRCFVQPLWRCLWPCLGERSGGGVGGGGVLGLGRDPIESARLQARGQLCLLHSARGGVARAGGGDGELEGAGWTLHPSCGREPWGPLRSPARVWFSCPQLAAGPSCLISIPSLPSLKQIGAERFVAGLWACPCAAMTAPHADSLL